MEKATAYNKQVCFIFFQTSSFVIALLIPFLTRFIHRKTLTTITLIIGGLGLLGIVLFPINFFIPASIALGLAWGSSLAIHFGIIASNLPKEKMGLYLGLFNVANASSQIMTGIIIGPIIKYFLNDYVIHALSYSGIFLIIGAFFNQLIQDKEK